MAISNKVENWLRTEDGLRLLIISWILGALILFSGYFFSVSDYVVPVYNVHDEIVNKQYGLWWAALNWVCEFLILMPVLIFVICDMSAKIRITIKELNEANIFSPNVLFKIKDNSDSREIKSNDNGNVVINPQIETMSLKGRPITIDDRIASAGLAFNFLFVALVIAIVTIWFSACGYDLINNTVGSDLIFWGNGVIVKHYTNIELLLGYTIIVYIWLFVLVFAYLSSLYLTFIYSNHIGDMLSNPAISIPVQQGDEAPYLNNITNILKAFTLRISLIYIMGLLTTFILNLQLAYLESDITTMSDFLLKYINIADGFKRVVSRIESGDLTNILSSAPTIRSLSNDDIWFPSLLLLSFTLLALTGSAFYLWVSLNVFNQKFSGSASITISSIYYGFRRNITLAIILSVCSFFPNLSLIVIASIISRLALFVVNRGRTWWFRVSAASANGPSRK